MHTDSEHGKQLSVLWSYYLCAIFYVHLSNQAGEDKDSSEEVHQLEDDLEERMGLRQTSDSDQGTGGEVITAQIS